MPYHKDCEKRLRTDKERRRRNRVVKSKIKQSIKSALGSKTEDEAKASLKSLTSILDRAASKKVIHPNKASRIKSRISKAVRQTITSASK